MIGIPVSRRQRSGEPAAAALFTDRAQLGDPPFRRHIHADRRNQREQLEENLQAREFEIPPELAARLGEASRPEPAYPYYFFGPAAQPMINAGTVVQTLPTTDRLVPYGADPASWPSESS